MPGVPFVASPNFRPGGVTRPPRGLVLHIAAGTYQGTIGWQHNAISQVSSYFVNAKDGRLTQCVDLDDRAWTESAGNAEWIGIEHEGVAGDSLTPEQIANDARIYAFLVATWPGLKVQITDDPINGQGLGWHGMGGNAWGGHPGCPGAPIVAQRPQIISATLRLIFPQPTSTTIEGPMTVLALTNGKPDAANQWQHEPCITHNGTALLVFNTDGPVYGASHPSVAFGHELQVVEMHKSIMGIAKRDGEVLVLFEDGTTTVPLFAKPWAVK